MYCIIFFFLYLHLQQLQRSEAMEHATGQVFYFVAVQHSEKGVKYIINSIFSNYWVASF